MSGVLDMAVVGAGPAGLAATVAATSLGCEVTLIDTGSGPGGQIYRPGQLHPGAGPASNFSTERLPPRLARFRQARRFRHLAVTSVWQAARGDDGVITLYVAGPEGGAATTVQVRAVVLATGASELVLPFPGWDLPGVTTAGAAQALLKSQGVTLGRRVLVAGSGPLLLPVAAGLAEAGVTVAAVLEAARTRSGLPHLAALASYPGKLAEAAGYAATLARHRVPVRTGHAVIRCEGDGRVHRATMARLDRDWRPVPHSQQLIGVDAVHVSFGLSPAVELARALGCATQQHPTRPIATVRHNGDQATSTPGVFAAGEITGVAGAEAAEIEGYLAGASAARFLGKIHPAAYAARTRTLRVRLRRTRRFGAQLDAAFPFGPGWQDWPEPATIACRCEDVPWSAIRAATEAGARDVRTVKGLTRCGMGYCQGRICGPPLQHAIATLTGRPLDAVGDLHTRPIATPISLGEMAEPY